MNKLMEIKAVRKLKEQVEENPVAFLVLTVALMHAGTKLMDANTSRKYAKIHAMEVARRVAKLQAVA